MDWPDKVIVPVISSLCAFLLAIFKANKDAEKWIAVLTVKLAASERTVVELKKDLEDHKHATSRAIASVATEVRNAARELQAAAGTINTLSATQAVINTMSGKALDGLVKRLDENTNAIERLQGAVSQLNVVLNHLHNKQ